MINDLRFNGCKSITNYTNFPIMKRSSLIKSLINDGRSQRAIYLNPKNFIANRKLLTSFNIPWQDN